MATDMMHNLNGPACMSFAKIFERGSSVWNLRRERRC